MKANICRRMVHLCASLLVVCAAGLAAQVVELEQRLVGPAAVDAAIQSPVVFLDSLRNDGIAVGMQVSAEKWSTLKYPESSVGREGSQRSRVADVTRAFTLSHPGWSAEITTNGIVLRDTGLRARADRIPEFNLTNVSLEDAFIAAQRAVNPSIPAVGGFVGSVLSNPDDGIPIRTLPTLVSVYVRDASLEEVLNAIAHEAPGTGWVLVRNRQEGREFDLLSVRYRGNRHSDHHWPLEVPRPGANQ